MANRNSKRRKAAQHKELKKTGFPKPVFKKKARPFPRPNPDADLRLVTQREIFSGTNAK